jgi:hypothetical protein
MNRITIAFALASAALLDPLSAGAQTSSYTQGVPEGGGSSNANQVLFLKWTPSLPAQVPVRSTPEQPLMQVIVTDMQGLLCTDGAGVATIGGVSANPNAELLARGLDMRGLLLARARGKGAKDLQTLVARVEAAATQAAKVNELYGMSWNPGVSLSTLGSRVVTNTEPRMVELGYNQRNSLELGQPVTVTFAAGVSNEVCFKPQEVDQLVNEGLRALRAVIAALGASAPTKGTTGGSGTLKAR